MRASLRTFIAAGAVWFCLTGLVPAAASAFGSTNLFGFRAEHERITRLALGCRLGQPDNDGSCFQPNSLYNLAGGNGNWGAVEAADNLPLHLSGGPAKWHCDDADYLDVPGYPQSRADATKALDACRTWARQLLFDGPGRPPEFTELKTPTWGALAESRRLLDSAGNVDVNDPGSNVLTSCTFNGDPGRVKCNVWEAFGYLLHAAEDFYSHGNWADESNSSEPISITNPPGLAHPTLPSYWNLTDPTAALPDPKLTTGCYGDCGGRISHDVLNKDKEDINTTTGLVTDPQTVRGKIGSNAQYAVNDAVAEARRQWAVFRKLLVDRYGAVAGGKMICALTSDNADGQCNDGRAETVFAPIPAAPVTAVTPIGSAVSPQCLYVPAAADGTNLQLFACNGGANEQFKFNGDEVKFYSTGTGSVQVLGKCLDAPSAASGTRIQIRPCNGSEAQQVTVTPNAELGMRGGCLTVNARLPQNGSPVDIGKCGNPIRGVWQFR